MEKNKKTIADSFPFSGLSLPAPLPTFCFVQKTCQTFVALLREVLMKVRISLEPNQSYQEADLWKIT